MIQIRHHQDRGSFDHGWLKTSHTFSFGDYYDPQQMGFRALRVINEDHVAPGKGFGMHGHRDMEIVTYVLSGELEHRDSLGHGEVLRPGEFQRMSAGKGIRHSEFNPSADQPVHLYQIWLLPSEQGIEPSYEQRTLPAEERHNRLQVVASGTGREGAMTIHQDAEILLATLDVGKTVRHELKAGRQAWLQVLRGEVELNGTPLVTSDGAAISDETSLALTAVQPSEVMLFDLP